MNKLTIILRRVEMIMKLGEKRIEGSYDEFEELYEKLEKIFGIEAIEDNNDPEKLDKLDAEIAFDNDISEN